MDFLIQILCSICCKMGLTNFIKKNIKGPLSLFR